MTTLAQTTSSNTAPPDYLAPYLSRNLANAEALTNINANPYQPYAGPRVADFSGLQNQAFNMLGQAGISPQTQQATGMAQGIYDRSMQGNAYNAPNFQSMGLGYLNTATDRYTDPNITAGYMSPYMQNVVDVQTREAQRQADMQTQARNKAAVAAGAFGGSRRNLMDAEAARNLAIQKGDIQAQGLQQAYQQGAQMFTSDQGRGLQSQMANQNAALQNQQMGLGQLQNQNQFNLQNAQNQANINLQNMQTGLGAANAMGQFGQNQYTQTTGLANSLQQAGALQQANQQARLDVPYQYYQEQLNYPYKQLSFMSDIMRGNPGTSSTSSVYQAPPSFANQLLSYGLGAYGLSNLFGGSGKAAGGEIKRYKKGGAVKRMGQGLAELGLYKAMGGAV